MVYGVTNVIAKASHRRYVRQPVRMQKKSVPLLNEQLPNAQSRGFFGISANNTTAKYRAHNGRRMSRMCGIWLEALGDRPSDGRPWVVASTAVSIQPLVVVLARSSFGGWP